MYVGAMLNKYSTVIGRLPNLLYGELFHVGAKGDIYVMSLLLMAFLYSFLNKFVFFYKLIN